MTSQMSPTNVHENYINNVTTVKIVGDFSLIKRDIKSTKAQMRRGLQTNKNTSFLVEIFSNCEEFS